MATLQNTDDQTIGRHFNSSAGELTPFDKLMDRLLIALSIALIFPFAFVASGLAFVFGYQVNNYSLFAFVIICASIAIMRLCHKILSHTEPRPSVE